MNVLLIIAGVYLSVGLLHWLRMVVGVIRVRRGVPKLGQPAASPRNCIRRRTWHN